MPAPPGISITSDASERGRARRLLTPGPVMRPRAGLSGADALLDPLAEVAVHVGPVLEGTLQHRLGDAVEQVADDVGCQPVAGGVVHALPDHGAGLAPVVV